MQGKFYIKTFGCQMNVADTERMSALLSESGMTEAPQLEDADLILINGCSVRDKAVHKAVSELGRYKLLKHTPTTANPKKIIGLGGCVGQLDKGEIFSRAPYLDFVFGTDVIDELPEIIDAVNRGERHSIHVEFDRSKKYSTETKVYGTKSQAFVNIMKGCDKYCTYCIVPYTRGREKSRTIDEVLEDCAQLAEKGVREITLLGQNVNSFGKGNANTLKREPYSLKNVIGKVGPNEGEENFPQLLRAMDQDPRLTKLKRIRFTSSHPLDFSDELIECYAANGGVSKLCAHLHLPVQSGSNRILQKMGRHHKIEDYIAQMERLKTINPEIGLSTDIIVGFPSETEEDVQATLRLLDQIEFDNIYAFAYSSRPGTRAEKLPDDVSVAEKNRRLNLVLDHQMEIARKRYAQRIGKVMEVLVEGFSKSKPKSLSPDITLWTGHTSCSRIVNFTAETPRNLKGQFINVLIEGATGLSLSGKAVVDSELAETIPEALAQQLHTHTHSKEARI